MSLEGYYHTMLIVWCKKENLSPDPNQKNQILNPSDSKNVGFVYQNWTMNEPIQPSKNSENKYPPT